MKLSRSPSSPLRDSGAAPAGSDIVERYRLDVAYDGTDFSGWAKQPDLDTVAGTILTALATILGEDDSDFGLRVAGRTDAGVHATGQVAHIDVSQSQLKRAGRAGLTASRLNGLLPNSIRLKSLARVTADFDARFAASQRHYRYRIADSGENQLPENARYTLWHPRKLDAPRMNQAAQPLIGVHDFAAFCKPRPGATTIRELRQITVLRDKSGAITIHLAADAFCHNMVRSLVGAMIAVGEGRLTDADLVDILNSRARGSRFKVVPPHGLTLTAVDYPSPGEWNQQVAKARNRRDLE